MDMSGYVDGELDMICGGLFDNIDDLLDFSTDDEALGAVDSAAAAGDGRQQIAPPPAAAAPAPLSGASDANKICDDLNIGEDWIADFLDDSSFDLALNAATAIVAADAPKEEEDSLFQSFSPVSVLSSSSISDEKSGGGLSSSSSSESTNSSIETIGLAPVGPTVIPVPGRARSKRPRRAAPAPAPVPIIPPAIIPQCEFPTMRKKKKSDGGDEEGDVVGARKCRHCGIQKTPQWRAGPTGPKTLCNACGVRYKSGRLFPEYRPAASPTYVPSVHSNSHKRVVEMRNKSCRWKAATPSPDCPAAKNCDLLAYIKWRRE